ncbi:T-cell receptor beta [Labeo rohita]|nr:T-cell receptor beta [Labeo rohita]
MIRVLLVLLLGLTCSVVNESVNQNPSNLIKPERDTVELVCEHNIPSYSMIFWYKQTLGIACFGKTVLQTPDNLIKSEDESAVIKCSHKIASYERILWYKQSQGSLGFKLMGYLYYNTENKEPEFENKIKLEGDGRNNGTLTISNLMLNDKAVYFCAACDTVLRITSV